MIPQLLRRTKVLRNNKQLLNKKTTTIDLRTIASQQGRLMCRRVYLSNHNMKIFPTHLGHGFSTYIDTKKKNWNDIEYLTNVSLDSFSIAFLPVDFRWIMGDP